MDLKLFLIMQKELDKTIFKNADIEKYPLEQAKIALVVELGELANEWQGFKYWKKHRKIDRAKLLEEFADCLSFALSLENQLHQIDEYDDFISRAVITDMVLMEEEVSSEEIIEVFQSTINDVLNTKGILKNMFVLASALKITFREIEQAYLNKNYINHKRQAEGY